MDLICLWTTPAIWRNWRFPRRDGGLGRPACRPGAPRAPRDQQNAQKDSLIADSRPLLKFNVGRVELQPQHKGRTSPCLAASRARSRPRRAQGGRPAVLGALRVSIVVFFGCQELSSSSLEREVDESVFGPSWFFGDNGRPLAQSAPPSPRRDLASGARTAEATEKAPHTLRWVVTSTPRRGPRSALAA